MRFDCFVVIACAALVLLDLFHKGFELENVLAALIVSGVALIAGKNWLIHSRR